MAKYQIHDENLVTENLQVSQILLIFADSYTFLISRRL